MSNLAAVYQKELKDKLLDPHTFRWGSGVPRGWALRRP